MQQYLTRLGSSAALPQRGREPGPLQPSRSDQRVTTLEAAMHRRGTVAVIAIGLAIALLCAAVVSVADQPYHGNTESKIFHKPTCRYYNCKNCTRVFFTRQAALEAGYRPCKVCKP